MPKPTVELISRGHQLLEAPLWHPQHGLLATDAQVGGVWRFAEHADPELIVANRKGIGGMALHADGGLVISGRNVACKRMLGEAGADDTLVLLGNDPDRGVIGFNDLTTDQDGRIYVGSLGFRAMDGGAAEGRTGFLHMIDLDGSSRVVAQNVELTNGLGWSPDGTRLYHSDSSRHVVKAYDRQPDGSLKPPAVFALTPFGHPDGLAVAQDGSVWVAMAFASVACRFAPDGHEIERVEFPVPMVTSLCFGGPDLGDLYVVSGAKDAPPQLGGCVFRVHVEVPGLARPLARVRLPAPAA